MRRAPTLFASSLLFVALAAGAFYFFGTALPKALTVCGLILDIGAIGVLAIPIWVRETETGSPGSYRAVELLGSGVPLDRTQAIMGVAMGVLGFALQAIAALVS